MRRSIVNIFFFIQGMRILHHLNASDKLQNDNLNPLTSYFN